MERLNLSLSELKFDPGDGTAKAMTFEGYGRGIQQCRLVWRRDHAGVVQAIPRGSAGRQAAVARDALAAWRLGISADDMTPVGVWTEMSENTLRLRVKGQMADTPRGRDLYTLMRMEPRPAINGLSIGFIVKSSSRARSLKTRVDASSVST